MFGLNLNIRVHILRFINDPSECDLIVCWEHDWKECPIDVIELKSVIQKLKG